jgi:glucokinase-like ROK family protein
VSINLSNNIEVIAISYMLKKKYKDNMLKYSILKDLYFEGALSCAELSKRASKSLPVVAKILSQLIEENFVIEKGYAPSSGGRRPLMYALKPRERVIVAVAMDQLNTRIVLYDLLNNQIGKVESYSLNLFDNPAALQELVEIIKGFLTQSKVAKSKIVGVGIGMPGFVDIKKGINYSFLNKEDIGLREFIGEAIDLPVYIDNDSSLIALAELRLGAAKNKKDVMVINVAWGIGLGIILNGEIFRGHSGFAGEFSHIPTIDNGSLCSCGKRGCLETEASLLVVAEKARDGILNQGRISSLQHEVTESTRVFGDAVMEAALKGDQYAIELFDDAGYALGKGIAVLIHILNPEIIVLSGRGARVGKILSASIQQALHKYSIPRLAESTTLQISQLGYDAELIGAAALVVEYFAKGEFNTYKQPEVHLNN